MNRKSKAAEFVQEGWDIQITGRHVLVTDSMKDYAMEKISKIERFTNRILDVQVTMDIQKLEHRVDIIVKVDNVKIKSHAATDDMYASIDKTVDKLTEQLRRYKTRVQEHHSLGHEEIAMRVNVYAPTEVEMINDEIEEQTLDAEVARYRQHAIVKQESRPLRTLTHQEAIMKMDGEMLSENFMIFLCEEDQRIKVIYRRPDGNYGIIETEA